MDFSCIRAFPITQIRQNLHKIAYSRVSVYSCTNHDHWIIIKVCILSWVAGASEEGPIGPRRCEFSLFVEELPSFMDASSGMSSVFSSSLGHSSTSSFSPLSSSPSSNFFASERVAPRLGILSSSATFASSDVLVGVSSVSFGRSSWTRMGVLGRPEGDRGSMAA